MSGRDVDFTGGAFGHDAKVAVATDELMRVASLCESVDVEVAASAKAVASLLLDVRMELIRCAGYAPLATVGLDFALFGHAALSWMRSDLFADVAMRLRRAARTYDDADAAVHQVMNGVTNAVDAIATPIVVGGALVAGAAVIGYSAVSTAYPMNGRFDPNSSLVPDLLGKGQAALNHIDAGVYEHLVNGAGVWATANSNSAVGLLRRGTVNSTTSLPAAALSTLYRGGDAHVSSVTQMQSAAAPATVAALVATLSTRRQPAAKAAGGLPTAPEPPGRVDVLSRDVRGADGRVRRSHVVVLQGTSMWNLPLLEKKPDLRDAQANLQLRAGIPTAEMKAMPAALRRAGVKDGDDVHFVGFSQGGATAAALSSYPAVANRFNVRSVVTTGGPVGGIHIPDGVTAVHLQDHGDPVPSVDGQAPSQRANEVTMGFTGEGNAGIGRHDTGNYARGAELFDAAADSASGGNADDGARSAAAARQRLVEVGALSPPGENAQVQVTRVDLNRDV